MKEISIPQATIPTQAASVETTLTCSCCGVPLTLPLGETVAEDEDPMCFECVERAGERVGVDYDAVELGGES